MSERNFEEQASICVAAALFALVLVMVGFISGWAARECVDHKVNERMKMQKESADAK